MKAAVICFTLNGYIPARKALAALSENGDEAQLFTKSRYLEGAGGTPVEEPLSEWTGRMFACMDAVIFVGAAGICVRAIAPFVSDKKQDPAVIVLDEHGRHCIPLLSGHLGGANELALYISRKLGCTPVLTTATDINGTFAVDVFAKKNGLKISDAALAKEVSARLLAGEKVGFMSEFPFKGTLPEGLCTEDKPLPLGIYAGIYTDKSPYEHTLFLVPEILCAGTGCRKGTEKEKIEKLFNEILKEEKINPAALCGVSSIDLKKDEEGLKAFCKERGVSLITYTAAELSAAPGTFTPSEFVKSVTGVDNVCERAAVLLSEGGSLIRKKTAANGVTAAFAVKKKEISFE